MVDLTPIFEAVIALIAALITAFFIPFLKEKLGEIKYAKMLEWVTIAVNAAEMLYKGPGRGEEKKEYVIAFLEEKGFTADYDGLNAMIEAAVLQLQNGSENDELA